ncbi:hypothetical protein [Streptomyces hirsutus]|uniref:hypothetical protein n=1 Tax=Streptomyces hirsutus TaxID=35620 RepID=UPI0033EA9C2C
MGERTQLAANEEKLTRTGQVDAGPSVATAAERRLDAENWLLSAALDRARARTDWAEQGVALLRCDGPFNAVKICADLVHAAAGTDVPGEVDAYLAQALHGGPVFYDLIGCEYYVLVPPSADRREWSVYRQGEAEFLGQDCCMGVPRLTALFPEGARQYWRVPLRGAGELASVDAVTQLIDTGRFHSARAEGLAGG